MIQYDLKTGNKSLASLSVARGNGISASTNFAGGAAVWAGGYKPPLVLVGLIDVFFARNNSWSSHTLSTVRDGYALVAVASKFFFAVCMFPSFHLTCCTGWNSYVEQRAGGFFARRHFRHQLWRVDNSKTECASQRSGCCQRG